MTCMEMMNWLDKVGARYEHERLENVDFIYIYAKDVYDRKINHPKKYANEYLPYLRLSWHYDEEDDRIYVRDNGYTGYRSSEWIMTEVQYRYLGAA